MQRTSHSANQVASIKDDLCQIPHLGLALNFSNSSELNGSLCLSRQQKSIEGYVDELVGALWNNFCQ